MAQTRLEAAMLIFLPPIVQVLGGIAVLGAGVAVHSVILDALGGLSLAVGGARWLRRSGTGRR
jgi:hypothetical protein